MNAYMKTKKMFHSLEDGDNSVLYDGDCVRCGVSQVSSHRLVRRCPKVSFVRRAMGLFVSCE